MTDLRIHPAVLGWLQELPSKEQWTQERREDWLRAFHLIICAVYPVAATETEAPHD